MHEDPIDWSVDPDVARAETVDARLHTTAAGHALALERVFAPSWQLVNVPDPSHRIEPFTLLEGGLDEPLVLVRDGDGERVLSNVCTHRGALVADAPSDARGLRCRYHGRRFGLDGALGTCPGFEGAEDFPRERDHLASVELRRVGPLRFVSIAPRLDFEAWAAPMRAALAEFEGEDLVYDPASSRAYDIEAGWAVYCENYLEGFHIPFVHPGLNAGLDFSKYTVELEPHAVRQLGVGSRGEPELRRGDGLVAEYLWLHPNLMVNVYVWGISVNVVEPTGVGRCRVRYLRWVARPEHVGEGVGGGLDEVELEDQEVVVSVQRGLRSRLYPGGRFSPRHETGTHHFQRLLSNELSEG
ncbi:MAG: SRPBCC family protein [Planctomycetota bacterium]